MERLKLLLLPSVASAASCLILAVAVLGASAWSYIEYSQLFYEYLFGAYGFKTILLQAPDSLWAVRGAVLNSVLTYHLLLIMCGALAGLTTYTVLEAIGHARRAAQEVLNEMHHTSALYKQAAHEAFVRLGLRVASIIGWTMYVILFFSLLVPYSIYALQAGIDQISNSAAIGWLYVAVALVLLFVSLHMHLVFARLCWLRPRLFGGDTEIEEAEAKED